jgi:hypothetical protein
VEEVAELKAWARPPSMAVDRSLPVAAALGGLLPDGLRKGTTVAVVGPAGTGLGITSLALALLAGPSEAGSWCAVVGMPELGPLAAAELGVDLSRLALVHHPRDQWGSTMAALVDAFGIVLARVVGHLRAAEARQLVARTRRTGCVLVVTGEPWPVVCELSLSVSSIHWNGLGRGHGHLEGRMVEVVAEGRRGASRPRRARLWLPAPQGGIAVFEERAKVAELKPADGR